jgi:hypothetical protein
MELKRRAFFKDFGSKTVGLAAGAAAPALVQLNSLGDEFRTLNQQLNSKLARASAEGQRAGPVYPQPAGWRCAEVKLSAVAALFYLSATDYFLRHRCRDDHRLDAGLGPVVSVIAHVAGC